MLEIWKFEKTCIFPKGIADGFGQKFEISSPCLSWLKLIKKIIVDILNRKITFLDCKIIDVINVKIYIFPKR